MLGTEMLPSGFLAMNQILALSRRTRVLAEKPVRGMGTLNIAGGPSPKRGSG